MVLGQVLVTNEPSAARAISAWTACNDLLHFFLNPHSKIVH